jgi:hypothetical protein
LRFRERTPLAWQEERTEEKTAPNQRVALSFGPIFPVPARGIGEPSKED